MPVPGIINLNDATPAAPSGFQNAKWQADSSNPRNVSDYVPSTGGVNKQTTSYTAVAADNGKIISVNAAGATTLTLPASPPFAQWCIFVENIGAGTLTVSPNGLNLDGSASSITVGTNQGTYISTDGTNYFTGSRGFGLTNPMTTKGDVIVAATSGTPARLGVGANGKVLTANSSATDGLDYEAPIALTTTGTSGAASLTPGNPYVLNVPNYAGGGGGGGMTLVGTPSVGATTGVIVLGTAVASVGFSSIPSTFGNLLLIVSARSAASLAQDTVVIQLNGDTAADYDYLIGFDFGSGSSANPVVNGTASPQIGAVVAATGAANYPGFVKTDFANYAGTAFYKTASSYGGDLNGPVSQLTTLRSTVFWRSTAALNAILLKLNSGGNFVVGSTFYLYGY